MSDQSPFQEKANWKGRIKEKMTSFIQRGQKNNTPSTSSSSSGEGSERTLTGMLYEQWNKRLGGSKGPGFNFAKLKPAEGQTLSSDNLNLLAVLIAILLVTYIGADLTALTIEKYIPEAPNTRNLRSGDLGRKIKSPADYQMIISRNLFNSRGLIPGDEVPTTPGDQNNAPIRTTLPLNLIGTVILRNELRSIATIEDKDSQNVYPVRVDDEIPGKAKILSIEPYKVIFINPNSGRREFVDIPEDLNTNAMTLGSVTKPSGGATLGASIEQTSPNQFNLPRAEVDRAVADLNKVLTEARAIPHTENGVAAGYKLIQIVPGSIYDKLGLKNGDVLSGLNGEPINDPGKAWEMLNQLKTQSRMELSVKRDGKTSNFVYDIR